VSLAEELRKTRDTYRYHLILGKVIVHRGICYDLALRETAHQKEFPGSVIRQVGRRVTREAGLRWEREGAKRPYKKLVARD